MGIVEHVERFVDRCEQVQRILPPGTGIILQEPVGQLLRPHTDPVSRAVRAQPGKHGLGEIEDAERPEAFDLLLGCGLPGNLLLAPTKKRRHVWAGTYAIRR